MKGEARNFEVVIEVKKFNEDGEKISKPANQFMHARSLAHFLEHSNGYSVNLKSTPEGLTPGEKDVVNKAIVIYNEKLTKAKGEKKAKKDLLAAIK